MTVDFLLFSTLLHLILTFGFCYAKSEGHWGEWGAQSPCSVTCGSGTQTIERVWIPGSGESSERYKSIQTFTCTDPKFPECPRDGAWSAWGAWNECSKPCGGGEKERIRECLGITAGGKKCDGESLSKEPCNKDPCPPLPRNFAMSQCNARYNFTCESKKMCILMSQKCDHIVQCHDGSDEVKCPVHPVVGPIFYKLRNSVLPLQSGFTTLLGYQLIVLCLLATH